MSGGPMSQFSITELPLGKRAVDAIWLGPNGLPVVPGGFGGSVVVGANSDVHAMQASVNPALMRVEKPDVMHFYVYNNANRTCYVLLGGTPADLNLNRFTCPIPSKTGQIFMFRGAVSAMWDGPAADLQGFAMVTEVLP